MRRSHVDSDKENENQILEPREKLIDPLSSIDELISLTDGLLIWSKTMKKVCFFVILVCLNAALFLAVKLESLFFLIITDYISDLSHWFDLSESLLIHQRVLLIWEGSVVILMIGKEISSLRPHRLSMGDLPARTYLLTGGITLKRRFPRKLR